MEKTNEVKEHYNIQEACEAQKQYVMNYAKNHPQDIFADMFAKGERWKRKRKVDEKQLDELREYERQGFIQLRYKNK